MSIKISFDQKPKDAIKYLEGKGYQTTFSYKEMMHEAHHKAFTVAKIAKVDLLKDIHQSLQEAQNKGIPFQQWKQNIRPTLQKKGWWGEVEAIDPKTGEVKNIFVGSRRLKTIFYTNMRTSYAVGRYEQKMRLPDAIYWRYIAILDGRTRPKHKSMHGVIKLRDDTWWETNYPPNGWNCRCIVQALTKRELKRKGLEDKVIKTPIENIAEKDWTHNVGKGGRFFDGKYSSLCPSGENNAKKRCINRTDYKKEKLPDLRNIDKTLFLPTPKIITASPTREDALKVVTSVILGDRKSIKVQTPLDNVLIDAVVLKHFVEKQEARERYVNFILPTLENPLEVWFTKFDDGKIRPQYIALFDAPKAMLVSVIVNRDGSFRFWNSFAGGSVSKMNKLRKGDWFWKRY